MSVTKDKSRVAAMLLGLCSLISYAVFHVLVGSFLFAIYSVLEGPSYGSAPDPQANARLLATAMVGSVMGAYGGSLAWLSHRLFKHRVKFMQRAIVAVASPALIGSGLLTILKQPNNWRALAIYFIPGAVLGLITGLIAEARRNPWDLLLRGGWRRVRETQAFAILSGVGLRLSGLFGLLVFVLILADSRVWEASAHATLKDLAILLAIFTYFGLTTLIAFASPPRWLVLVSGLLINVPTVILFVVVWEAQGDPIFFAIYLLLWVFFLVSRPDSVPRTKLNPARLKRQRTETRPQVLITLASEPMKEQS